MDIPAIRADLKLTQAQLAQQLAISPGHMGDIERGHRKLTIKLAARLEEISQRDDIVSAVVAERTGEAA